MTATRMRYTPRSPTTPRPTPNPPSAPTGRLSFDQIKGFAVKTSAPFLNAPPPSEGTLGAISHGLNTALGVVGAPFELLETGFATLTSGIAAMMPAFPAATLTAPHIGMPHAHSHPPSLIPPAPPVPLPSIGMVAAAGCTSVLIGGVPAARASDLGPAPTCGSFSPMFEVYTGSSNTLFGGSRAARMTDITRHCNPASAVGKFGKAMAAAGVVAGGLNAATDAAAGAAQKAAMQAVQAAADAVALAMSAFLGKDPGIPPAMGALMVGNPTVLIGGIPMPDVLDVLGGLAKAAKHVARGAKKLGKKAAKLRSQICLDPSEPISLVTGEVYNDFDDAVIDPATGWTWTRHYRSGWHDQVGPMGRGFRHAYERRLELRRRLARFVDFNGIEVEFVRDDLGDNYGGVAFGYVLRQHDAMTFSVHVPGDDTTYGFRRPSPTAPDARLVEVRRTGLAPIWLEYDAHDRVSRLSRVGDQRSLHVRYDAAGLVVAIERQVDEHPPVRLATYAYDETQSLRQFRNALGGEYAYAYDDGRMIRAEDPRGYGFRWAYDHLDRCIACQGDDGLWQASLVYEIGKTIVTEGDGGEWTYLHNDDGVITHALDPCGGYKHYRVDERGVICEQTDPTGLVTRWLYDTDGHHYARVDPWGAVLPPENDDANPATGRELRIPVTPCELMHGDAAWLDRNDDDDDSDDITPVFRRARLPTPLHAHAHAVFARPVRVRSGPATSFDLAGHEIASRDAWGHESRREYSPLGECVAEIDADGRLTRREYGSWSLVQTSTDATGGSVAYRRDHREKIVEIVDGAGHRVGYERDLCGRVVGVTNDGEVEERYAHDEAGRQTATFDGEGNLLITYVYGDDGQCAQRIQASGEVHSYGYDHRGLIREASTPDTAVHLAYDGDGTVRLDQRDGAGIVHEWIDAHRRKTVVFDRFEIETVTDGQTTTITTPDGRRHRITQHPGGFVERSHDNGLHELTRFDDEGRCTARYLWRDGVSETPLWHARHEYSPAGDLLRTSDSARGQLEYGYDEAHRITSFVASGRDTVMYAYCPAGNLVQNAAHAWLRHDARHQLVDAPGERFAHNRRYDLVAHTRDEVTATYHYNSLDRLVRVTWDDGRPVWTAAYDGLGRRLCKEQAGRRTEYYWDGPRLAAEIDPDGRVRIYVYPTALAMSPILFLELESRDADPSSARPFYVFHDQVGMPARIHDANGYVVWWASHVDAYGQLEVGNRSEIDYDLRWPGHWYDRETGLHYNRFRYYDPRLGRYLQTDPLGQAGGLNVYAYPANPLVAVDVFGLVHRRTRARQRSSSVPGSGPRKKGPGEWKSRRVFRDGDTGLKDHALRHSDLTPPAYLRRGQQNIREGKMLKGGGAFPDAKYWVRKLGDNEYSLTITDHKGQILSIDTWQNGGTPMNRAAIEKGLSRSGITPPKGFWESL